jgi:cytosine/adenosine deaminase-related metal-dependent hydrolase
VVSVSLPRRPGMPALSTCPEPRTKGVGRIIRNVQTRGGDGLVDVRVEGQHITAVEPDLRSADADEIDGGGGLLLPGFVNPHQHLDK